MTEPMTRGSVSREERVKDSWEKTGHLGGGIYIPTTIGNQEIFMLLDTGATVSILSLRTYQALPQDSLPDLSPPDTGIFTANGQPVDVKGRLCVSLAIGAQTLQHMFYVADIESEVILGLDFLDSHECTLNVAGQTLVYHGQEIPLYLNARSNPSSCRLIMQETLTVPKCSEMIIPGCLADTLDAMPTGSLSLVETMPDFAEKHKLIVATSLNRVQARGMPVRVLNPGEEPIVLYKGTTLAHLEPVLSLEGAIPVVDEGFQEQVWRCSTSPASSDSPAKLPDHLQELFDQSKTDLDDTQRQELECLLKEYYDVFMAPDDPLGSTNLVQHHIDTGDSDPIRQPPRRAPWHQKPVIESEIRKMLKEGVIEPADGPWASPIVLVRKKDGTVRFCVDFRKVNQVTKKDAYPIPRIDDSLDALSGSQFFSTLDLVSGYWQVDVHPKDKEKTAFGTHMGLFQFRKMPFGLCNAPSTFERLMERVLKGLQWHICLLYLDDIVVFSTDFQTHLERLRTVFGRMRSAQLKMKAKKCHLFRTEVEYLGHIISRDGVATAEDKIQKVRDWPTPSNAREVRQFLGLTSYYRRFVKDYAKLAKPMHRLTEKGRTFHWTPDCQEAFETLKQQLTSSPILAYPDMNLPFILDCDASNYGLGGVLSQVQEGKERVIAYASFSLTKPERNYCVTRKELLAVVRMVKHFKPYLYGQEFLLRTDHGSLRWLCNFKEPEGQLARWLEVLSEFNFKIQHRPGRSHQNADALSRLPCPQCKRETHDEDVVRHLEVEPGGSSEKPDASVSETSLPEAVGDDLIESLSSEELSALQLADPDLKIAIGWKEAGIERPPFEKIAHESPEVKALWGQWNGLYLRDGILYLKWESEDAKSMSFRLVVPRNLWNMVLEQLHDVPTGGHLGFAKVWGKAQPRFYWYKMKAFIQTWLNNCLSCARRKGPPRRNRAPLTQQLSGSPMERVCLDILGPLPKTSQQNRYILVVSDTFTKFTEAYALPDIEAETVAQKLVTEFICRYGVMETLHSDQGRQFESQVFQDICKMLGIRKTRTSPYHPQGNAQVERFNRTLADMLTAYVRRNQRTWDYFLPLVLMAYRAAVQESTGETPNKLTFGRQVRLPLDLMLGRPPEPQMPIAEYAIWIQDTLWEVHRLARQHLHQAAKHQKRDYERNIHAVDFKSGDVVMLHSLGRKVGVSPKLQDRWDGPYVITQKLSDVTVRIKKSKMSKPLIVHTDRLKRFKGKYDCSWFQCETANSLPAEQGTSTDTPSKPDLQIDTQTPTMSKRGRIRKAPQRFGEWHM